MTERFGHALWEANEQKDERRARTVSEYLQRVPGVMEAVAAVAGPVRIEFDRTLTSEQALRQMLAGMDVVVRPPTRVAPAAGETMDEHEPEHAHEHLFGENTELIFAVICTIM